jgi:ABC-type multidrug transport system permease subunit
MFIGYVFRSEESVIFASMITAGIFLFFSNTIIPIENTSGNLISFSFLNPLILLDSAFKKVLLFGLSFSSIILELAVLFGFFIVFLVLTYFVKKITRREPSI